MKTLHILQHIEREGPGLFRKIAEEKGFSTKIYRIDLGDKLPILKKNDLLLILGGPMGLEDMSTGKFPWLKDEVIFIKKTIKKNIGIIGVCLGAQLLAYSYGGNTEKLLGGIPLRITPEVGWSEILVNQESIYSQIIKEPFYGLHWHSDRIILPPHADLIASSKLCKEQLFKIADSCIGIQFHIEYEDEMIKKWIKEDYKFINNALGPNGQRILENQHDIYGKNSIKKRVLLINKLIDLINNNKKAP
tara:strand:- start:1106 stop:1846 length:741 start_codon:yes stop_codon:yes gene_type:complete